MKTPQTLNDISQKQDLYICCLQETNFRPRDTYRLKMKGWKKIFHENGNKKKSGESSRCWHAVSDLRHTRGYQQGTDHICYKCCVFSKLCTQKCSYYLREIFKGVLGYAVICVIPQ